MLICRKVLDTKYTLRDSYVICTDDYYNDTVLPLNLSIFLLMGIIIPVFLILKLRKKNKKKELRRVKSRRIFGYFYNELKLDKYFWDFLLMVAVN